MTPRSIQNWMAAFRRAEAESGCGYLGLLDRVAERGNRNTRIPEDSKQLLEEYLKNHYIVPQAKRAAAVYRLYRRESHAYPDPLLRGLLDAHASLDRDWNRQNSFLAWDYGQWLALLA